MAYTMDQVHAIHSHVDAVYVLNLASRPDRMKAMKRRLQRARIQYERHEALPGSIVQHYYGMLQHARPFTNANYVACSLSHLQIFAKALARNQTRILILEDDVVFHKNSEARTTTFFESVTDQKWDLLYLAYIPLNDDMSQWTYPMLDPYEIKPGLVKSHNLWSLMAYCISDRLMRHCLSAYQAKMPMELDRFFVQQIQSDPSWISFAARPQIVAGHDGFSDNSGKQERGLLQKSMDSSRVSGDDYDYSDGEQ